MTTSIGSFDTTRRRDGALGVASAALRHALAWPIRIHRARQMMLQLGQMGEHELRDIGLTRLDLHDANALSLDADPSLALQRRVEERRRRR